jgi:hypothetical protein
MRLPAERHSASMPHFTQTPAAPAAYTLLLQADERARARGRPLLTEAGVGFLRQKIQPGAEGQGRSRDMGSAARGPGADLPHWDAGCRRLWLGGVLLKEFRQPSPHQTRLLDVFQEQGWAITHIDDPLLIEPGEREEDAKRRLHDTIKNLNRGLPRGTIRFRGDGTGQGVLWQYDGRPS